MMMALGFFVFSLHTAAYQELQRQLAWRHASVPRVGDRPASQYIGPDDETITLAGVLLPELAGERLSLFVKLYHAGVWTLNFGTELFNRIPSLWLYGGLAFVGLMYVTLFGLGAAAYRTLYRTN